MDCLPHHWADGLYGIFTFHTIGMVFFTGAFMYLLAFWLFQSVTTTKKIVLQSAIICTNPQTLQLEVRSIRHNLESNESSVVLARAFKDDPVQEWYCDSGCYNQCRLHPNPDTRMNELAHTFYSILKEMRAVHVIVDRSE